MSTNRDGKVYPLKNMPSDIYKMLIEEQKEAKLEKMSSQYSLEQTIYRIIRKWDRCKKEREAEK